MVDDRYTIYVAPRRVKQLVAKVRTESDDVAAAQSSEIHDAIIKVAYSHIDDIVEEVENEDTIFDEMEEIFSEKDVER